MTESFRREGEYPQENRPAQNPPFGEHWQRGRDRLAQDTTAGAYPPPPAYPPAAPAPAPGRHEAHQPPVIQGETVPAGGDGDGAHAGNGWAAWGSAAPAAPAAPAHAARA
ncbi:serine protease, partial [Streptomyces sp. M-16]